jgi:hypothetical protein
MRNRETIRKVWVVIGIVMILGMILLTLAPLFAY